jgi:Flp pilus assembly protein TadB
VVDQLDPGAIFYFSIVAIGGIALASGYAAGLRLNVGALLIICIVSGLVVFLASFGSGSPPLVGILIAVLAMTLLQAGYFTAVIVRAAASRKASSEKDDVEVAQGAVNSGKGGSP